MRGVWFGLCLLAAAAVVLYTLVFGGPIATVILLALILLTLAEPSQPAKRAAGRPASPPAAPYYCDRYNSPVPADAKFCPQCGDEFRD